MREITQNQAIETRILIVATQMIAVSNPSTEAFGARKKVSGKWNGVALSAPWAWNSANSSPRNASTQMPMTKIVSSTYRAIQEREPVKRPLPLPTRTRRLRIRKQIATVMTHAMASRIHS